MERIYDETYRFGKAIIYVVAPLPMSEDEKDRRLSSVYQAAINAWNIHHGDDPPVVDEDSAAKESR
jgi:hypothetical protein